jgi:hypothetical protein
MDMDAVVARIFGKEASGAIPDASPKFVGEYLLQPAALSLDKLTTTLYGGVVTSYDGGSQVKYPNGFALSNFPETLDLPAEVSLRLQGKGTVQHSCQDGGSGTSEPSGKHYSHLYYPPDPSGYPKVWTDDLNGLDQRWCPPKSFR